MNSGKPETFPTEKETSPDPDFDDFDAFRSDGEPLQELPPLPKKKKKTKVQVDDDDDDDVPVRRRSTNPGMSVGGPVLALISGTVGGAIGAVIWGVIAYFAHAEVGYVAWGIGGLVGFCVRIATGDMDDFIAGVMAAVLAVVSILAGKLLAAIFIANWLIQQGKIPGGIDQGTLIGVAFAASFGVLDIVFFLLAVATAYRLGSGNEEH